jgi:hypothetical protein
METTCAQYNKLLSEITQWLSEYRITQLRVLALWIYGLFQAKHCSLHKVSDYLPLETNKASRIQRLERFLKNPGILVKAIYAKIVKVMLIRLFQLWVNMATVGEGKWFLTEIK